MTVNAAPLHESEPHTSTNGQHGKDMLIHDTRPMPNMLAFNRLGFYMSYFCVGIVYGFMATVGPNAIFVNYFQLSSSAQNASLPLVTLPWSFKIFVGMMSDRCSIGGLRRKPFLLMGWSVAIASWLILCLVVTFTPESVVCTSETHDRVPCEKDGERNPDAAHDILTRQPNFHLFLVLVVLNAVGYVFADVCMDSMSIDLSKRESPDDRGRIQANLYMVRQFGWTLSSLLGFALNDGPWGGNGPMWGGHWYLSFPALLWIVGAGQCLGIPFWLALKEDKMEVTDGEAEPEITFNGMWTMMKQPAFAKLCCFAVVLNFCQSLVVQARNTVLFGWVHNKAGGDDWNENWATWDSLVQSVIQAAVLWAAGVYFKKNNWRMLELIGVIVWTVGQLLMWLVILDVTNSRVFVMLIDFDQLFSQMLGWMVTMWVTVEMAPKGLEGSAIALTTTVGNAGQNLATYLNTVFTGIFGLNQNPLEATWENRHAYIGNSICVIIGQWLFVFILFSWLPKDRHHAAALVADGLQSVTWAKITLAATIFAVVWGMLSPVMTIFCPCNGIFNIGAALGSDSGCDAAPAFTCGPAYGN